MLVQRFENGSNIKEGQFGKSVTTKTLDILSNDVEQIKILCGLLCSFQLNFYLFIIHTRYSSDKNVIIYPKHMKNKTIGLPMLQRRKKKQKRGRKREGKAHYKLVFGRCKSNILPCNI
jgi:hypothetical protein